MKSLDGTRDGIVGVDVFVGWEPELRNYAFVVKNRHGTARQDTDLYYR